MGSSIPAAMDYLVANTRLLPACAAPAVVSDGFPTQRSDLLVAIGVEPDGDDTEAATSWAEISDLEYENVEVPCLVAAFAGGDQAARARDKAFEAFDAILAMVREDRKLGGAIRLGLPARINRWRMEQTTAPAEAGVGRMCRIRFMIAWQNRF